MENKIFDSELKILEILWTAGELPARSIAALAAERSEERRVGKEC